MSKDGFFSSLKDVDEFFKQQQEDEEEFSQYGDDDGQPYFKEERHHVHTEDDSITKQWRGY